jgi:hypothetical protein
MADGVTVVTETSTANKAVMTFTNQSDGTGESLVQKVDISTLEGNPTSVKLSKAWFCCSGMSVEVYVDHTSDQRIWIFSGSGYLDFTSFSGIQDPGGAGGTGDYLFSTVGHTAGDTYSITLELDLT